MLGTSIGKHRCRTREELGSRAIRSYRAALRSFLSYGSDSERTVSATVATKRLNGPHQVR